MFQNANQFCNKLFSYSGMCNSFISACTFGFFKFIADDLGFIWRNNVEIWVALKDDFACTSRGIPSIN